MFMQRILTLQIQHALYNILIQNYFCLQSPIFFIFCFHKLQDIETYCKVECTVDYFPALLKHDFIYKLYTVYLSKL